MWNERMEKHIEWANMYVLNVFIWLRFFSPSIHNHLMTNRVVNYWCHPVSRRMCHMFASSVLIARPSWNSSPQAISGSYHHRAVGRWLLACACLHNSHAPRRGLSAANLETLAVHEDSWVERVQDKNTVIEEGRGSLKDTVRKRWRNEDWRCVSAELKFRCAWFQPSCWRSASNILLLYWARRIWKERSPRTILRVRRRRIVSSRS